MAASPVFAGAINLGLVQIVSADASNYKSIFTAGASGSKLVACMIATDETAIRVIQLAILRSAVSYVIGSISIPVGSGNDGVVPAVNLLNTALLPGLPIDNDGQVYLVMKNGDTLQGKSLTTVTAAKTIHISAYGGDL